MDFPHLSQEFFAAEVRIVLSEPECLMVVSSWNKAYGQGGYNDALQQPIQEIPVDLNAEISAELQPDNVEFKANYCELSWEQAHLKVTFQQNSAYPEKVEISAEQTEEQA